MERNVAMVALFAALIAVLGLVPPVTLAFGVPITAQSLGVMLAGTVLGARRGALAVLLFVGLVALGLPLLSGGRGGLGVFASPTVGYLLGFPVAAFVAGAIVERWGGRHLALVAGLAAAVGGIGIDHAMGIVGMSIVLDRSLGEAVLLSAAFVPGDLLKAAIAGMLTAALARARPGSVPSRSDA